MLKKSKKMFKRIKRNMKNLFKKRESICGLSKAMRIVDKYIKPGIGVRALDLSAGYATEKIRRLHECGEITKNEMDAALTTLDNHYTKLRQQESRAELMA